jgi:hypothetical protein
MSQMETSFISMTEYQEQKSPSEEPTLFLKKHQMLKVQLPNGQIQDAKVESVSQKNRTVNVSWNNNVSFFD